MNGVLHWNKRSLDHHWWSTSTSGGNIYYRIPYTISSEGMLNMDRIGRIVTELFKRNPDFEGCGFAMASVDNKATTKEYVTAIVITSNRQFYQKYTDPLIS